MDRTRRIQEGQFQIIYSGRENDKHHGIALVLKPEAAAALISYDTISPRMLKARFRGQHANITVIQVYAPTASSLDYEIEEFYTSLQTTLNKVPTHELLVVMGDFNTKVGQDWHPGNQPSGSLGLVKRTREARCY